MPGEKSTFSITPFLNRTSLAPEIVKEEEDGEEEDEEGGEAEDEAGVVSKPIAVIPAPQVSANEEVPQTKAAARGSKKVLSRTKPSDLSGPTTNRNAKPLNARKRATASTLENVIEEGNDENDRPNTAAPSPSGTTTTKLPLKPASSMLNSSLGDEPEAKKKKRKLLGAGGPSKTLFDDDEAEAAKPAKSVFGGPRGFPSWVKGGLAGPKGGVRGGLAAGGGATGFAAFSPLKKDRRRGDGDTTVQ
jgi:hypothetical protein